MDSQFIEKYYQELDPMKRLALLEQSIQEGEEPEANAVRKEIWEIRYQDKSEASPNTRADGYLALWMAMEFNKNNGGKLWGAKSARKEITKHLEKMRFRELRAKGPLYELLLYRECCHMVKSYMELCESDRNYNTTLCGIVNIGKERGRKKLQADVYQTAVALPEALMMEEELGIITRAAREMYRVQFEEEL